MKKIFVAMLALAAATACSNDELVSVNREAIAFDNAFINNSVRSVVDPSSKTGALKFDNFTVYGYVNGEVLFNGIEVSQSISNDKLSSVWKYNGTQYWIESGVYDFSAVAPLTNGNWTLVENSASKDGVTLNFTNNGTVDLLYAKTASYTALASGNPAVAFNFKHVLSKVKFSFTNTYDAYNTTIRVKDITITDAYKTATVALSANAPAWTVQNGTLSLAFGNAATSAVNGTETFAFNKTVESYNELFLIPSEARNYTVTFNYDIVVGNSTVKNIEKTVTLKDFAPVAGHAYDIAASITPGQPIEFTVNSIGAWDETDANKTIE